MKKKLLLSIALSAPVLPVFADDDFFDPYSNTNDIFKKDVYFDSQEQSNSLKILNAIKELHVTVDGKQKGLHR